MGGDHGGAHLLRDRVWTTSCSPRTHPWSHVSAASIGCMSTSRPTLSESMPTAAAVIVEDASPWVFSVVYWVMQRPVAREDAVWIPASPMVMELTPMVASTELALQMKVFCVAMSV